MRRRGQITLFVIVAIVIVVAVALIFLFRDTLSDDNISENVQPIKEKLMSCLEKDVELGVSFLESNGGYIEGPEFESGNRLNPSSSKLSFGGFEIPYWGYLSGSSLYKEQIPTKEFMEDELENFLEKSIMNCDFDEFGGQGFIIKKENPVVKVKISDDYVDVNMDLSLSVTKGENFYALNNHEMRVDSNLGFLYDSAVSLYEKQKKEMFLENYGVDVLRLYLPVDGVELTCSPLIWNAESLYSEFKDALSVNYMAITNQGKSNDYFTLDFSDDVEISFLYSSNWPTYFEVSPTDDGVMVSKPVGNERGMGILGFCYVPYHYIYDAKYPVLVRLEKDSEIFQFPIISFIEGNLPREAKKSDSFSSEQVDICQYKNTKIKVNIYDSSMNPLDAKVSFECFGSHCNIGSAKNGELVSEFPQCANGLLSASLNGYRDQSIVYSTMNEGSVTIVMDKEYERRVDLDFGGVEFNAIITFSSEDYSKTIVYPEEKSLKLAKGVYDVNVMVYSDSSIKFPESEKEQCVDVPRSGILGIAGMKQKECTTVVIPEQTLESALVGGGTGVLSVEEGELVTSSSIIIRGDKLKTPTSLEELHENYILVEVADLEVGLR